ncbi:hypothetical protein O7627_29960 [Solwaraspora sp. WMMD1047]|uniref:hypothetical protein n=1 Tax=Solwaraspora sp. WMMD1047 TaxID=3016102 RepID=UPI002416158E|nr:hypothetical protein [Solwaraspora sp. WMMD1047]MDG4833502.1 hypothetical protein [Solwaraspora sp. WMMD1047]
MTRIEDSLRELLAARAESTPPVGDPAGAAIRRGRAIQRRRSVGSALAVAMALVLTVGGISSIGGWWRPGHGTPSGTLIDFGPAQTTAATVPTAGPAGDTGIGLDVRVGDRLWTTDGRQLLLTGVGEVTRIIRVPDGWVYAGASGVRFLRTDGTSVALSGEDDRWVLSPGGDRIAFVIEQVLYVARLRPSGLAVLASVEVPPATAPIALLGDRVVIQVEGRGFDTLDPARAYQPAWNDEVTAVFGVRGDSLAALVRDAGGQAPCLAELRSTGAGLEVIRTGGCGLDLRLDGADGRLAPGGGWLAEPTATQVALVDWDRAVANPTGTGAEQLLSCPIRASVTPTWADDQTVLSADAHGVVRCRTDGSQQAVALPEGVGAGWQFVPRVATAPTRTG